MSEENSTQDDAPKRPLSSVMSGFIDKLEKRNVKIQFGLEQQGHIATIERLLQEYGAGQLGWYKIGKEIGWCKDTACRHYLQYLLKKNRILKEPQNTQSLYEMAQEAAKARIIEMATDIIRSHPLVYKEFRMHEGNKRFLLATENKWVSTIKCVHDGRSGYDQLSAEPYFEELNAFYLQWRQELRMDFDFKVHVDIDGPIANSENLVSDAI